MKKYVVAKGIAFTANGHIYSAGDEISESVFSDKVYFAKMLSEGKILSVSDKKETVEKAEAEKPTEAEKPAEAEEEKTETENVSKKSSKKSKAE